MKVVIIVLVVVLASFLSLAVGALNCGDGGAPDASWRSMCNCYSGYAPSTKASTDCNVNPMCPPIQKDDDTVGDYGANRPITSFANDRLNIYQSLPIVANRLGATVRLVHPVGIPGVTPGVSGAATCGYPGVLWNKTVNELTCTDELRGSIPWNNQAMCGFVLDTVQSTNATVIYRTTMVTQYNETFIGWKGQKELRLQSNAYAISVSFLRQKKISSMLVNITMNSPSLTLTVMGNVMFDSLAGTTQLTLRTATVWPYQINPESLHFSSFVSTLPAAQAPTGITAPITQDTSVTLACSSTSGSVCYQQWTVVVNAASNCDIEGQYSFTSTLACRDGASCGGAASGDFAFSLLPTDFCFVDNVDATANSVYILKAFQDAEHLLPAVSFNIGQYVYFTLTVVDPTSTLKKISFSNVAVAANGQRDILYTTAAGTAVTGVDLKTQEVTSVVKPGTPVDLSFSFQLLRPSLPKTVGQLTASGSSVALSAEATINLEYYGARKREIEIAMEMSQGSATTTIQVVAEDDLSSSAQTMYTIPFAILAFLSFIFLY